MDVDTSSVEVDVCLGQAIEFTNTQPSPQQDHNIIIVIPAAVLHELQILLLLLLGQRIAYISILRHHIRQLELERILANDVIIHCHFKCRSDNALQNTDGVLLQTLVVQGNEPSLSIRQADAAYHSASKRIRMDAIDSGVIGPHGVLLQSSAQIDIPVHQFSHSDLAADIVDPIQQVTLDHFFLLPQFLQRGSIDIAPFLVTVPVIAIKIGFIGALALA